MSTSSNLSKEIAVLQEAHVKVYTPTLVEDHDDDLEFEPIDTPYLFIEPNSEWDRNDIDNGMIRLPTWNAGGGAAGIKGLKAKGQLASSLEIDNQGFPTEITTQNPVLAPIKIRRDTLPFDGVSCSIEICPDSSSGSPFLTTRVRIGEIPNSRFGIHFGSEAYDLGRVPVLEVLTNDEAAASEAYHLSLYGMTKTPSSFSWKPAKGDEPPQGTVRFGRDRLVFHLDAKKNVRVSKPNRHKMKREHCIRLFNVYDHPLSLVVETSADWLIRLRKMVYIQARSFVDIKLDIDISHLTSGDNWAVIHVYDKKNPDTKALTGIYIHVPVANTVVLNENHPKSSSMPISHIELTEDDCDISPQSINLGVMAPANELKMDFEDEQAKTVSLITSETAWRGNDAMENPNRGHFRTYRNVDGAPFYYRFRADHEDRLDLRSRAGASLIDGGIASETISSKPSSSFCLRNQHRQKQTFQISASNAWLEVSPCEVELKTGETVHVSLTVLEQHLTMGLSTGTVKIDRIGKKVASTSVEVQLMQRPAGVALTVSEYAGDLGKFTQGEKKQIPLHLTAYGKGTLQGHITARRVLNIPFGYKGCSPWEKWTKTVECEINTEYLPSTLKQKFDLFIINNQYVVNKRVLKIPVTLDMVTLETTPKLLQFTGLFAGDKGQQVLVEVSREDDQPVDIADIVMADDVTSGLNVDQISEDRFVCRIDPQKIDFPKEIRTHIEFRDLNSNIKGRISCWVMFEQGVAKITSNVSTLSRGLDRCDIRVENQGEGRLKIFGAVFHRQQLDLVADTFYPIVLRPGEHRDFKVVPLKMRFRDRVWRCIKLLTRHIGSKKKDDKGSYGKYTTLEDLLQVISSDVQSTHQHLSVKIIDRRLL
jgi:hypothetical protein